jgi:hypothetical protein
MKLSVARNRRFSSRLACKKSSRLQNGLAIQQQVDEPLGDFAIAHIHALDQYNAAGGVGLRIEQLQHRLERRMRILQLL